MPQISIRLPGCWPLYLSWSYHAHTSHHLYADRSRPWFRVLADMSAIGGRGRCTNSVCLLTRAGIVHRHGDGYPVGKTPTIDDPPTPYATAHRIWLYFDRWGRRAALSIDLTLMRDYPNEGDQYT